MHKIKKRTQLAMVRELWLARDEIARDVDIAPGRLLSDAAISAIATAFETTSIATRRDLEKILKPLGMRSRWLENSKVWLSVISRVTVMPEGELPENKTKSDTLPHIKVWREKFPEKYIPLSHARAMLAEKAAELEIPVENLLTPELARRICWLKPEPSEVESYLEQWGARVWQIDITAPLLRDALSQREALELPAPEADAPEVTE
jgi:ribonuclease D